MPGHARGPRALPYTLAGLVVAVALLLSVGPQAARALGRSRSPAAPAASPSPAPASATPPPPPSRAAAPPPPRLAVPVRRAVAHALRAVPGGRAGRFRSGRQRLRLHLVRLPGRPARGRSPGRRRRRVEPRPGRPHHRRPARPARPGL